MRLLELTLEAPEENLALEEALLLAAEESGEPRETLRIWEPATPMAVIGSSSRVSQEVDVDVAERLGVAILRRASGGLAIVTGPGCLMYSVVLSYELRPELQSIDRTHEFVLESLATQLRQTVPGVERRGISDLALAGRKFSGNSVRCKRTHLLYHGTLLYNFPLEVIGQCLKMPPRQPDYRASRPHDAFITNLPIDRETLRQAVLAAFPTEGPVEAWPQEATRRLALEKYAQREWTYRSP